MQRGEGVALVLLGDAISGWEAGGKQWKSWNARMVSACFKIGEKQHDFLHVVSCYAPTWGSSRAVKDEFWDGLESFLNSVPLGDQWIMLGDFNARVGSRVCLDDQWDGVRGPYGFGELNDAGRELLSFLSSHEGMVCNTRFQKKDIHKQTWQHPKSGAWHCIDYILMHQKDRRSCLDVSVKRGAVCNTDHNLVCMEFKLKKPYRRRHECKMEKRRFDVSQLRSGVDGDTGCEAPVSMRFVEEVLERAHAVWPDDGNIDEQWFVFHAVLTESAASVLGYEKKHQPDWFRESSDTLNPFLQHRNDLYTTWLATGNAKDHDRFKQARGEARRAIRKAKNDWFVAKAAEIERGSFGGVEVWRGIRDVQYGRRGLIPSRVVTIDDENGNPCCDPVSQQARWRRHFATVFNICSHFDPQELDLLEQRPVFEKIAAIPSNNDVTAALAKVRNRKAPGSSGILPEMVKMGMNNDEFCDLLTNLLRAVWKEEQVPQEWVDAILIEGKFEIL
ncbi:uncharacterized protein [Dysidea avara]|uniref:uncharacterized protein n=1 Tax=Dysidea avara TaxID=196820 RepID=UPI00331D52AA